MHTVLERFGPRLRCLGVAMIVTAILLVACGSDNDGPSLDDLERQYNEALKTIDERVGDLRDDLADAGPDDAPAIEDEIAGLEQLRDETAAKLEQLASASDEEFEALRDDLEQGVGHLRDALDDLVGDAR